MKVKYSSRRWRAQSRVTESATAITFSFAYVSLSTATGALMLFPTVQMTMVVAALWWRERPRVLEWLVFAIVLGDVALLWLFISIPGASAGARRQDYLVAQPGTLTPASHPMVLPAASRSALTTPPTVMLSPLVPDTTRLYALPLPRSRHESSQLDTLVL